MRLVRGTDLQSMIDAAPLDPSRAVAIITQIAAALDAGHAEGLIHRDIKPQNIIVTPADFAYLVDFGIAEVIGDTRLTAAGAQVGSFAYMAPERFGGQQITPAIDVYALTCVLYEALTRQMPFQVENGTGYGAHAGRGSAGTSCFFANSVLLAYWKRIRQRQHGTAIRISAGSFCLQATIWSGRKQ